MAAARRQAVMPKDVVDRVIAAASDRLVLVGGQALAFWLDRYGIALLGYSYVSHDVDFLADSAADAESVYRLARALGGRAELPRRRAALTPLIGQAVRGISDSEVFNVDVLHKILGAEARTVRARAVAVRESGLSYRVMHPLDVLKSRLDNLHGLAEKQNDLGRAQLRAAIEMARAFQREAATRRSQSRARRPETLRYVGFIERLAITDAGRKIAKRHTIHVADAIEPAAVPSKDFRAKRLPQLARLMSDARRKELGLSVAE
jgi:hypothetical protein